MPLLLPILLAVACPHLPTAWHDPRDDYDVLAYHLALKVDVLEGELGGAVTIELAPSVAQLDKVRLDVGPALVVRGVRGGVGRVGAVGGGVAPLYFERDGEVLDVHLAKPSQRGQHVLITLDYSGRPGPLGPWRGVRWRNSDDQPQVDASLQNAGAHLAFPCKSSLHHPEDRPDRVWVDLLVPEGYVGVSNGRLAGSEVVDLGDEGKWVRWKWRHEYPVATYGVGLAVGRFQSSETPLHLPGIEGPVPFVTYVRPAHVERARVQFQVVPEILQVYSTAFGPWPFPEAKVGLVDGDFPTVDHSTTIGYGWSYPDWLAERGLDDPNAASNRGYDYALVHQLAHEWWGNSVAARSWSDYWLQEGFATYAESLWLEHLGGRQRSDAFFAALAPKVTRNMRVVPTDRGAPAPLVWGMAIFDKGAWVLHMAREKVGDDELWWRALREFQARFRYRSATTEDLRTTLESVTGTDWSAFFDQWVYGTGFPRLVGRVEVMADHLSVEVDNRTSGGRSFHVHLDLGWREGGEAVFERVELVPGENSIVVPCASRPEDVQVLHLDRLLGIHTLEVVDRTLPR